ncbi:bifunctional 2',3'-cyclic-nucleotide 2'-phosphodiesterase/3'-nucleotidase [Paracoccus lutimaris]|uniref:2',3'-cyclic-nucleotide 2'-phosphodiesterase/3'-nucleotidase n=1 Tax=Paracoccus lutimaris TaxID=1490030 RepID=A0A368ZC10_9RHOB|nr:bifunctional 2',3'-cyclic-nucleotide 2'-phosphodiesterase/3'-nucleotidase [Paracoccus lutimaris]RCW88717.1 2',3'-cyclic-nucleotide 2'-phosphodiesterase/3'-nucleotidase [Paracoccus lutimaris]
MTSDARSNATDQFRDRIDLRIMATTDLHMHVLGYDYLANRPSTRLGLSRTAALIARERKTATNSLLFDNGDFLQGSPMGDYLAAADDIAPRRPHPAIAAMNALDYDAGTIGNHDFSFGMGFLRRTLEGASFPFVATNLVSRRPLPSFPDILLPRKFRDRAGRTHLLQIGVLGFMPPQTVEWEPELKTEIRVEDILTAARAGIARLQAAGADLILALSHSGIGALEPGPMMENAATALAALPGIDMVIAGHTHRVFPAADHPSGPGIDAGIGTLAGKPAVMPGFWGSHLGVIDLGLEPEGAGWRIAEFRCRAEPVDGNEDHPAVTAPAMPAHRGTLRHFRRRVGRTELPLSSYFTLIGEDPGLRLVTMAQRWHVRRALRGTRWESLPILSAAAPFRAGGRGGPDHYTDVPAGRLTLRNIADIYLFPNRICAIRICGGDVLEWLERSASLFRRIEPGQADQPLIDPEFPSYNFDIIDGLDWQIDLTRPPRYAPDGRLACADSHRITAPTHRGRPLDPAQEFILVTNSFRLSDCGMFAPLVAGRPVLLDGTSRTREVLQRYIARRRVLAPEGGAGWRFAPMSGTSVLFGTSPAAAPHLHRLSRPVETVGMDDSGFLQLRLHL